MGTDDLSMVRYMTPQQGFMAQPPVMEMNRRAREVNSQPLPEIRPRPGLRLPPESECLLNPDFQVPRKKKKGSGTSQDVKNSVKADVVSAGSSLAHQKHSMKIHIPGR